MIHVYYGGDRPMGEPAPNAGYNGVYLEAIAGFIEGLLRGYWGSL